MKNVIIIVLTTLQFLFFCTLNACAQKHSTLRETKDSIALAKWLENYDLTVLNKITSVKLPYLGSTVLLE